MSASAEIRADSWAKLAQRDAARLAEGLIAQGVDDAATIVAIGAGEGWLLLFADATGQARQYGLDPGIGAA